MSRFRRAIGDRRRPLRQHLARLAAQLIADYSEADFPSALERAARRLGVDPRYRPDDIPGPAEIRDQLRLLVPEPASPDDEAATSEAAASDDGDADADRFARFHALLAPLEAVTQNPESHPEGDALYHSLQVFELARQACPWDEELLLAALLHDVGKGLDPADHVSAALAELAGDITERTAFLIAHHHDGQALRAGTLGHRASRALRAHADFDALMLLCDCDERGRLPGRDVPTLEAALAAIAELAAQEA